MRFDCITITWERHALKRLISDWLTALGIDWP
jgi:hypothetical protein